MSIGQPIEVLTASTNREIDMVFAIGWEHARVCDRGLGNNGIVWIDEHRKTCGLRQQLVQEPKQFARKLKIH